MKTNKILSCILGATVTVAGFCNRATAAQESVIHTFDGSELSPAAPLISGPGGVLYGTTSGNEGNPGSVFRLTPPAPGTSAWTETVLTRFAGGGYFPHGSMLLGADGVLYGTTYAGGPPAQMSGARRAGGIVTHDLPITFGTVFSLTPPAPGKTQWTETVIHNFGSFSGDGAQPDAGLIADAAGTLYGTTYTGGLNNNGTIFSLTRPGAGQTQWNETILYHFHRYDGASPSGGLLMGSDGSLYGVTASGGQSQVFGTVYRLSPPKNARTQWTLTVLLSFDGMTNGGIPMGALAADRTGALYGTQPGGIYKLKPPLVNGGAWVFQPLLGGNRDIAVGVTVSSDGTVYSAFKDGTGVNRSGIPCGALFMLKPPLPGQLGYQQTVLHDFDANPADACQTAAAPIFSHDPTGAVALYGVGYNAVFRFSYADWK